MSYDDLSLEMKICIFVKLRTIYTENAKVIQKYWHKYAKTYQQKVLVKLWKDFKDNHTRNEISIGSEPDLIISLI